MTDLRVLLLDSNNRYPPDDSDYGRRIGRFIDRNACIMYIRNERANYRQIDLILSSADRDIISTQVPLFNGVYFHLYCPTADTIPENEALFPQRERVQVFEEHYLWIKVGNIICNHDFMRLTTIADRNQSLDALQRTLQIMLDEVHAARAGEQPN